MVTRIYWGHTVEAQEEQIRDSKGLKTSLWKLTVEKMKRSRCDNRKDQNKASEGI